MATLYSGLRQLTTRLARDGPVQGAKNLFKLRELKNGELVGRDQFGNAYYQTRDVLLVTGGTHRWVEYAADKSAINASQVPAEWHSWLHYMTDTPGCDVDTSECARWKAPHHANYTGSAASYLPAGHLTMRRRGTAQRNVDEWQPSDDAAAAEDDGAASSSSRLAKLERYYTRHGQLM